MNADVYKHARDLKSSASVPVSGHWMKALHEPQGLGVAIRRRPCDKRQQQRGVADVAVATG